MAYRATRAVIPCRYLSVLGADILLLEVFLCLKQIFWIKFVDAFSEIAEGGN